MEEKEGYQNEHQKKYEEHEKKYEEHQDFPRPPKLWVILKTVLILWGGKESELTERVAYSED